MGQADIAFSDRADMTLSSPLDSKNLYWICKRCRFVAQCVINLIKCYIIHIVRIYFISMLFISVWDSFIFGATGTCRRQRIRYYF